jgi:hypothetical protein
MLSTGLLWKRVQPLVTKTGDTTMAKLIYEDDKGRQAEFEFSVELISTLESQHDIDGWDEIFKAFKTSIKTQIEEDDQ